VRSWRLLADACAGFEIGARVVRVTPQCHARHAEGDRPRCGGASRVEDRGGVKIATKRARRCDGKSSAAINPILLLGLLRVPLFVLGLRRLFLRFFLSIHALAHDAAPVVGGFGVNVPRTSWKTYLIDARSRAKAAAASAAAMFDSRCATFDVPGIGSIAGDRDSNQAMAAWCTERSRD
jgi:hypothetical protein